MSESHFERFNARLQGKVETPEVTEADRAAMRAIVARGEYARRLGFEVHLSKYTLARLGLLEREKGAGELV